MPLFGLYPRSIMCLLHGTYSFSTQKEHLVLFSHLLIAIHRHITLFNNTTGSVLPDEPRSLSNC